MLWHAASSEHEHTPASQSVGIIDKQVAACVIEYILSYLGFFFFQIPPCDSLVA